MPWFGPMDVDETGNFGLYFGFTGSHLDSSGEGARAKTPQLDVAECIFTKAWRGHEITEQK